jgi:hypothetical protein
VIGIAFLNIKDYEMMEFWGYERNDIIEGVTAEEIVCKLWRRCRCHQVLNTPQDYMEWQKQIICKGSNGKLILDISDFDSFVDSLVDVGFLLPYTDKIIPFVTPKR